MKRLLVVDDVHRIHALFGFRIRVAFDDGTRDGAGGVVGQVFENIDERVADGERSSFEIVA